ncbi:hypothetical protein GCM10023079_17910 [Streptomyces chitinivorans]
MWLTTDDAVLRARVHAAGHHDGATAGERLLMDRFLTRTERYQALMLEAVDRLGLDRIDAGDGRPAGELADAVLAVVGTGTRGR